MAKKPTTKQPDYSTKVGKESIGFKDVNPNFEKIISLQRRKQKDEKFAISDSLATYMDKTIRDQGFGSMEKLKKAGIRDDIINYVVNYQTQDLDMIKGMDYNDAVQLQANTDKTIKELEGVVNAEELLFIKQTVGKTNARLGEILNVSTRMNLAFRDLKKEFTALKLAQRFGLTRIPFLGRPLQRAVEAEEAAESQAISLKQSLARKGLKESIRYGNETYTGFDQEPMSMKRTSPAKVSSGRTELVQTGTSLTGGSNLQEFGKEETIEQERESDEQFKETTATLKGILEESKLTNELLSGKKPGLKNNDGDGEGGILDTVKNLLLGSAAFKGAKGVFKGGKGILSKAAGLGKTALGAVGLGSVAKTATGVVNNNIVNNVSEKAVGKEVAEAGMKKTATKAASKGLLKSAIKKIPILGAIAGIGFALSRLAQGDVVGAGMEIASGAASIVPGAGTAASVAIDAGLMARDMTQPDNADKMKKTAEINQNGIDKSATDTAYKTQNINTVNNNVVNNINKQQTVVPTPRSVGVTNPDTITYINRIR